MTPEQSKVLSKSGETEGLDFKGVKGTRHEAVPNIVRHAQSTRWVRAVRCHVGKEVSGQQVSIEIHRIDPLVFAEIERVQIAKDWEVIVVRVNKSTSRPNQ